ncbi:hypothetical protein CHS0354_038809 [Potamilus streckersoni]|uniref:Uncharacterized protein n=1 Tax=Potamilus streckersoni TaxID=2493646 RepID=A0AAE0WD02_9BIVA|nr:hypothetical protein CHS0354_038809 [Potamilus streckersoni]
MSFKAFCKVDVIFFVVVLTMIFIQRNSLVKSSNVSSTTTNIASSSVTETIVNQTNTTSEMPESKTKPDFIKFFDSLGKNKDMLLRALYVLIAVTTIVIIYFGIKAWRVHRRKSKSRKYGIITKGADLEMEPLGKGDDDEEDLTVFEINNKNKKK